MHGIMKNMRVLRGDGVVEGIVLGTAQVSNPGKISIPKRHVRARDIRNELRRYHRALRAVKKRLTGDHQRILTEVGAAEAGILQSHILITQDPFFAEEVPTLIMNRKRNVEWIIMEGLSTFLETFKNIDNIFFKERGRDIEDVSLRIIQHLMGIEGSDLYKDSEGVLVMHELVPSMITHIDTDKIRGIVSEVGSETSHATILAKSLGIPVIINAKQAVTVIESGDYLVVDGNTGQVFVNPQDRIIAEYEKLRRSYVEYLSHLEAAHDLPAITLDGETVALYANVEFTPVAHLAHRYGAEGVGLFRTELPFLINNRLLSEREQLKNYASLLRTFRGKPVTIRTLDIGGDKFFPLQQASPFLEPNPFLGLRSIRVSLHLPEIFKVQLRALLKASVEKNLSILFPMISSYEEMEKVIAIVEEEKKALRRKGIPFDEGIKLGIMVEIPSAALAAEHLIKICDFFSIGTNDLIQYTLAADRTNEKVASYYVPENPAVLRLIDMTSRAASKEGKPCSVCGELAGNPLFTPFLLGVGIRQLSMEPPLIPQIKDVVRNVRLSDCTILASRILTCTRMDQIRELLEDFSTGAGKKTGLS
jgi:phosphotransferase system enzyme I (PtsI)